MLPVCATAQVRDTGTTIVWGDPIDRDPPDPGPTRVDREPRSSPSTAPSPLVQPTSAEPTIYQLSGTLESEISKADLSQLAAIAGRWNDAMKKAAAGRPKSTAYLSDRERAVEFLKSQATDLFKEKALEVLLPEVAKLLASLPGWLSAAMVAVEVSAPSPTASDDYQSVELDRRMQKLIWERVNQLLPEDAGSVFDPLRKLELPVEGASIRSM